MKYGSLIFEKKDYVETKRLLYFGKYYEDYAHKHSLDRLKENLDMALVCDEVDMPDDVVRLHSKVALLSNTGWNRTVELVTPSEYGMEFRFFLHWGLQSLVLQKAMPCPMAFLWV